MKFQFTEIEKPVVEWCSATPGEVYQSTSGKDLLVIRSRDGQALCIRSGEGAKLHSVWTPGMASIWHHVPSTLKLPADVN